MPTVSPSVSITDWNLLLLDESALTDSMKSYKSMRLKFKTKTEGIVSQIDPQRESQVRSLRIFCFT